MFTEASSQKKITGVSRTVLVVEADPQLRKSMSVQFERMDFHVLSASHYDGAVHHLAKGDLHVVCVDVQLPSKSGYELCEHIRGSLGLLELPILMTSEYGSPEEMAYAERAGGNAFLHKPFSMRQLAICVESLLRPTDWNLPSMRALQLPASTAARSASRIDAKGAGAIAA
jgi:DNA-binding response OmpR family regulator